MSVAKCEAEVDTLRQSSRAAGRTAKEKDAGQEGRVTATAGSARFVIGRSGKRKAYKRNWRVERAAQFACL